MRDSLKLRACLVLCRARACFGRLIMRGPCSARKGIKIIQKLPAVAERKIQRYGGCAMGVRVVVQERPSDAPGAKVWCFKPHCLGILRSS
jgi:uncharacterized protein YjeT (DUF2065 family)